MILQMSSRLNCFLPLSAYPFLDLLHYSTRVLLSSILTRNSRWTMYDSYGNQLGGPSSAENTTGAPESLYFSVKDPLDRNATSVDVSYPNDGAADPAFFSTGSIDAKEGSQAGTQNYYCEDVLASGEDGLWADYTDPERPGQHGFQRDFDCWFRGWYGNDFLGTGQEPPCCSAGETWETNGCVANPWGLPPPAKTNSQWQGSSNIGPPNWWIGTSPCCFRCQVWQRALRSTNSFNWPNCDNIKYR